MIQQQPSASSSCKSCESKDLRIFKRNLRRRYATFEKQEGGFRKVDSGVAENDRRRKKGHMRWEIVGNKFPPRVPRHAGAAGTVQRKHFCLFKKRFLPDSCIIAIIWLLNFKSRMEYTVVLEKNPIQFIAIESIVSDTKHGVKNYNPQDAGRPYGPK